MIDANIDGDSVKVEVTGLDSWPYLRPRVTARLPLAHITAARTGQPRKLWMTRHLNRPTSARRHGTFVWCRHDVPLLELNMDGQPYRHVVLSVPDPEQFAEEIRMAAGVPEYERTPRESTWPLPPRRRGKRPWWLRSVRSSAH